VATLWWAAPGALVAGSAIGVAVVVGPSLGQQVSAPRQLVVPATADAPVTARPSPSVPPVRHPHPRPVVSSTPTPVVSGPTTRVVQPRRPVVTANPDDSGERHDDSGEHENGDR